jgi:biotin carboxyl carrier protein
VEIDVEGARVRVDVQHAGEGWRVVVNGREILVDARAGGKRLSVLMPGASCRARAVGLEARAAPVESCDVAVERRRPGQFLVHVSGQVLAATVPHLVRGDRTPAARGPGGAATVVTAPMPGRIVKVLVASGDVVRMRQPLVVIEAMKMENELRAPADGIVVDVPAREGTLVEMRAVLAVLAPIDTRSDRRAEEP